MGLLDPPMPPDIASILLRAFGKNEHYGVKNLKQINEHANRRKAS